MPAARRSERGRSERRSAMQTRLLAALEAQLEQGASLAALKVDDLTTQAGVSRASFYIHFQDKVDLLEEWLVESRAVLLDVCGSWYSSQADLSRDRLRELLGVIFHAYRERLTLMRAMHETALYDATLRDEFADAYALHIEGLAAHIELGQASGFVPESLHAWETAEWLVCLLERVPFEVGAHPTPTDAELHLDAATDVIWSTLYAAAPNRT